MENKKCSGCSDGMKLFRRFGGIPEWQCLSCRKTEPLTEEQFIKENKHFGVVLNDFLKMAEDKDKISFERFFKTSKQVISVKGS